MANDLTLLLPIEIKAHVLSFTDQKTVSVAAQLSKFWQRGVKRYYESQKVCDLHVPLMLARDIDLNALNERLNNLLQRHAPEFVEENKMIRELVTNPPLIKDQKGLDIIDPKFKIKYAGLFYPYTKKADLQSILDLAGILPEEQESEFQRPRSGTIRPSQTTGQQHLENIKTLPASNHDPYAKNKADLLQQACCYGNRHLFALLLRRGGTVTQEHVNLAARCSNTMIVCTILNTSELNRETLYNATVTGSDMLVRLILKKNPQLENILCTPELLKAAEESQQKKMIEFVKKISSKTTESEPTKLRK